MADKNAQYDDERNPYYKQAQQDLDSNDPPSAIADYEAALGVNPKLAGAHYQLGLIYSQKMNDPISSIYHFRRFLELAPTSDQADAVKDIIEKQSFAFASSLPNSAPQNAQAYADLQNQVAVLKKQLQDASAQVTRLGGQPAPISAAPAPAPDTTAPVDATPVVNNTPSATTPPTGNATPPRALPVDPSELTTSNAPPPGARSYKVLPGDSLWKIAHKMYPHDTKNGVDKIKQANTQILGANGKYLHPGQILVIP